MKCYRVSNRIYSVDDYFPLGNWKKFVEEKENPTANHYESKLEEFRLEDSPESKSRVNRSFCIQ
jgi:hypothetical protein